jgi:cysteine desulfurase
VIYLDHNATTPVLPGVFEKMQPYLAKEWANPSSTHQFSNLARKAIDQARENVAALVGSSVEQVMFTSGATEAINSAIHSATCRAPDKKHIVISEVEHSATLAYCDYLSEHRGYEITKLPVGSSGELDQRLLDQSIREDTVLVSLIWANNETGVVWPVEEYSNVCRGRGVSFHLDAVQAVGKIPVNFAEIDADYLSLSGHKFGGVKGSGALIVGEPSSFTPMIYGGKQQNGMRGGTESVPLIAALGEAAKLAAKKTSDAWDQTRRLRDEFEEDLLNEFPGAKIHGVELERLPNTTSVHLPGIDSDAAVTYLDQKGICVSSGSACMESAIAPSHVIYAMTKSHEVASETLRVSLSQDTTKDGLDRVVIELMNLHELVC